MEKTNEIFSFFNTVLPNIECSSSARLGTVFIDKDVALKGSAVCGNCFGIISEAFLNKFALNKWRTVLSGELRN
jgi:hypothetical protein